jgi:Cytochrome b5-like Heme/Steroid binding domain
LAKLGKFEPIVLKLFLTLKKLNYQVLQSANEMFRKAAGAIFEASTKINNQNFISELLDALEDVGPSPFNVATSPVDVKTSQNVAIPTNVASVDSGVESMSTTLSCSVDSSVSSFHPSIPDVSSNVVEPTTEEEENDAVDKSTSLPIISMDEVGDHYTQNDSWMVIYDKVYDFTDFMSEVILSIIQQIVKRDRDQRQCEIK